jgi:hypothetical protein
MQHTPCYWNLRRPRPISPRLKRSISYKKTSQPKPHFKVFLPVGCAFDRRVEDEVPAAETLLICVVWVVAVRGAAFSPVFLEKQEPIATLTTLCATTPNYSNRSNSISHPDLDRGGSLFVELEPDSKVSERHGDGKGNLRDDPPGFCMGKVLSLHCSRNTQVIPN